MTELSQVLPTSLTYQQLSSHVFCLLSLPMIHCPCSCLRSWDPITTHLLKVITPAICPFWFIPFSVPICHCFSYLWKNSKNILSLDLIPCSGCCPFRFLFTSKLLEKLTYTCSSKFSPVISPQPTSVKFLSPVTPLKLLLSNSPETPGCSTQWFILILQTTCQPHWR